MHIEFEALDALVPNLLLQPLVENAIRHGIAPHSRPGWIAIHAAREGARLTIEIRDSGNGLPPDRLTALNRGVGLGNTRARLDASLPVGAPVRLLQPRRRLLRDRQHSVRGRAASGRIRPRRCRMTKIRTLVVDDEPVARARLLSLLGDEPDIEVVGECASGPQAVSAIAETSPDLMFLDVQMPEMDGFELARTLGPERMPAGRLRHRLSTSTRCAPSRSTRSTTCSSPSAPSASSRRSRTRATSSRSGRRPASAASSSP